MIILMMLFLFSGFLLAALSIPMVMGKILSKRTIWFSG
jgi:hypothetical protein